MNRVLKTVCASLLIGPAATALGQSGFARTTTALPTGAAAIAYGPDGSLFVFGSMFAPEEEQAIDSVRVIDPAGNQTTVAFAGGVTIGSPGGAAFNAVTGELLVTDNADSGELLSVNPLTGQTQVLASGVASIDDVAVRSTGEIFVSSAAGLNGAGESIGAVLQVNADGSTTQAIGGLGFAAGLDFLASGDLVFQNVSATTFVGSVAQLAITQDTTGLVFGDTTTLASNVAGSDLAVDSEDDIFVSGGGGLFELTRDSLGDFTGDVSLIEAGVFASELDFLAGTVPFEAFTALNGDVSGRLTLIPSFASTTLTTFAVPEPGAVALVGVGGVGLIARRRRKED